MKLSKKGEYALRLLIDLGIAREVGRDVVQLGEVAAYQQIPAKFLEQIILELRRAGFVDSRRGKFGGYLLARPADQVTMGAVVRAIEGPLAPIACVSQTAYAPCTCPDEVHCGLRMLMMDVRNAIAAILDRYTLADVVAVTLRKMRRDGLPLPFAAPARTSLRTHRGRTSRRPPRPDPSISIINNLLERE
jgi:Rrf2 family protein